VTASTRIPRTPLQQIYEDPRFSQPERIQAVLTLLTQQQISAVPEPTPNPEFWPISDVIPLPAIHATVQFNPRGGKVVILDTETQKVHIIPFDPSEDPRWWMNNFAAIAERQGLDKAVEVARGVSTGQPASPKPFRFRPSKPAQPPASGANTRADLPGIQWEHY
jgi:hypothetical protein